MENASNQKINPSDQKESHPSPSNSTQNPTFPLKEACSPDSFSAENNAIIMRAKQILYPPFFSPKGLAQDILELTQAELDVPLNTFIGLYPLIENGALKDKLTNLFGTAISRGILHTPEHLMGGQKEYQLFSKLPKGKDTVFKRFRNVLENVGAFEKEVKELEILDNKEAILNSLSNVRAFYNDYEEKILSLCQIINQKKSEGKSADEDLHKLSLHLESKAIMFGELLPNGPAYRIPRDVARHILSLDSDGTPLPKDEKASANHRVSSLPYHENSEIKPTPRVFFKANGLPFLKPGKEAMISSLYRLLNIPVPTTGLLVLAGVRENDPDFHIVQASEAVIGESPKVDPSWKEELKLDANKFMSFCQQVLGAILTNPSDGKPANFIYHKEKYGLVSIDNDEVFHQSFSADFYIKTKSFLYCLEVMDKPIPRSLSNFLATLDIELLLLTWLSELDQKNNEYKNLESFLKYENARQHLQKLPTYESQPIQALLEEKINFYALVVSFQDLSLPITISTSLLDSLKTQLSQIAKILSDPGNFEITPQRLLEKISPYLGVYFKNLRREFQNPLKAIKKSWSAPYCMASSLMDITGMNIQNSNENQNENSPQDLFEILKQSFKDSNTYQLDSFIQKHGERRMKRMLQPEEALKEMLCLIRLKLITFQNASDIVHFWSKAREGISDVILIEQWDNLFFLFSEPEFKWLFSIEKHFKRGWSDPKGKFPEWFSDVKGAFIGKRSLSEEIIKEVFDKFGAFKEDKNLTGRSKVAKFPKQNPLFYLKKDPEIPGYDYAATLFMRTLGLEGIPFSDLLLCKDPKQGLYSVLLTQGIQGDPLDTVWKDEKNLSSLDPHHTFLLILCSILINPEDGKGDNYILTPDRKRIIPIDNDHVFLPGTIQEEKGFFTKTVILELQSKTVLYCLNEMNKPIPESVAQIFTQLDIDKFLETWLHQLVYVNEGYQTLPPLDYLPKAGKQGAFFRIPFRMDFIKNLYTKLARMKHILSQKNIVTTPFDLLKSFEPFVGNLYSKTFDEEPTKTTYGRFMKITDKLLEKDKNGHQISKLSSIEIFKILNISKEDLTSADHLCKHSPYDALEFLKGYSREIHERQGLYQRVIRGEAELPRTDLSLKTKEEEKTILDIAFKRNREAIVLHNSKLLDGKFFSNIFDSFTPGRTGTEVRLLDLRGTQKLNSFCILLISAHLPNIEYLNIGYHPELSSAVFLGVNFNKMKRLVITKCDELSGLIVESSLLDVLEVRDNPKLENVLLYTPNLTYFDFAAANGKTQIHMFKSMENLQVKPRQEEMEKIVLNKIDTLEVVQKETDSIIEKVAKDIATEQCNVTEKRNQEMKDDMPDIAGSLLTGPVFYLMSKALVGMVSFMINDSKEKRIEKLQPKVKEMIFKMVKNSFGQNEKKLGNEKEISEVENIKDDAENEEVDDESFVSRARF